MQKSNATFTSRWDVVLTKCGAQHVASGTGTLGYGFDGPEVGVILRNAELDTLPDQAVLRAAAEDGQAEFSRTVHRLVRLGDRVRIAA